ncbi:MAG: circadian clock protein KaiA [Cyanobacteria bacterium J06638_20]
MLLLCSFAPSPGLSNQILAQIQEKNRVVDPQPRYDLTQFETLQEFLQYIEDEHDRVDCLLLEAVEGCSELLWQLKNLTILLPTVILKAGEATYEPDTSSQELLVESPHAYHDAVAHVASAELTQLDRYIEEAIARFLRLSSTDALPGQPPNPVLNLHALSKLSQQQHRLAEKLKARLEYLGIYYKRNPANFLRRMQTSERQELIQQLKQDYRKIVLNYFSSESSNQVESVNTAIDTFVNLAFFADVSVAQIVELHMELMDEFAKQLKLEGRNADILQDYRLTLIDIIAHLCEMYRRSIPRES